MRPCEIGRAERSGRDLVLERDPHGVEPVLEAHRVRDTGALGGVEHVLRVVGVDGDRLLAQHVLARLDRGDGLLGMELHRRAHRDEVEVVTTDELAPVGGRAVDTELRGRGLDPLGLPGT